VVQVYPPGAERRKRLVLLCLKPRFDELLSNFAAFNFDVLSPCTKEAGGGGGGSPAPAAFAAGPAAFAAAALFADVSRAGKVVPLGELGVLSWDSAVAVAGSKASACSRLSAIAEDAAADFRAPPGAVLPFGSMEA
jgi:hypothetical protein